MGTWCCERGCYLQRVSVTIVVLMFIVSAPAFAQKIWTENSAYRAWIGYKGDFYTAGAKGGTIFSSTQGGSTITGFWENAEEIQLVEDAYEWARKTGRANLYPYKKMINRLCLGFADNIPTRFIGRRGKYDWSGDKFNDDLNWAVIAFTRAYQITGNPEWLSVAKENFDTVWRRAQNPNGKGDGLSGLIQSQPHGKKWTPNLDAPANFGFVIAGYRLYESTGSAKYKKEADNVYQWAMANLYRVNVNDGAGPGVCVGHAMLTCAKIYDGTRGHSDYTYNYGIAIEAATLEGDYTKAQFIANWLMYNSNNPNYSYAGTYTMHGVAYNILPNYKQGGRNDAGYNGIALRGVGFALSHGALNAATRAWADANLQAAWELKNLRSVMWNDWDNQVTPLPITPGDGLYSWDCSSALAGMFDIPAPASGLGVERRE